MTVVLEIGQDLTTIRQLIMDALLELNIIAAGDPAGNDDAIFALAGKLNRLLDDWNADRIAVTR